MTHKPDRSGRPRRLAGATVCLAGAIALWSLPAAAAVPQAPADPALIAAQGAQRGTPPREMGPPSTAEVQRSIETLHQQLRITSGQESAFRTVAAAMRAHARDMRALPRPSRDARLSVVEGMRLELRYVEAQAKGLRQMVPALEALYARLSPQQRREADAFFRPRR